MPKSFDWKSQTVVNWRQQRRSTKMKMRLKSTSVRKERRTNFVADGPIKSTLFLFHFVSFSSSHLSAHCLIRYRQTTAKDLFDFKWKFLFLVVFVLFLFGSAFEISLLFLCFHSMMWAHFTTSNFVGLSFFDFERIKDENWNYCPFVWCLKVLRLFALKSMKIKTRATIVFFFPLCLVFIPFYRFRSIFPHFRFSRFLLFLFCFGEKCEPFVIAAI